MGFLFLFFCFFYLNHNFNRRLADEDDELSEVQPDAGNLILKYKSITYMLKVDFKIDHC